MSIQNNMQIFSNRTIENPLKRYDKTLARKINLLENPKNKKKFETQLQKKIIDLKKAMDLKNKKYTEIDSNLTLTHSQILPEKHLTAFGKWIKAISCYFSALFCEVKPSPNAMLLSQKANLQSRKKEAFEDLIKINRELSATQLLIEGIPENVDDEIENAKKQITNNLKENFKLQINGKKFSDPSRAIEALEEISPIYKPGQYTLLQLSTQTLPTLLKNATIDLVNQSLQPTRDSSLLTVKENQKKPLISIDETPEGRFTVSAKATYEVSGAHGEFFSLTSKIEIHLDENGMVKDATVSHEVEDYPAPKGVFFSPGISDHPYEMPPIDERQFAEVALKDSEESVWVSKNFKADCDRQINQLHITGIGTLTHRHSKLLEARERLNKLRQELDKEIQKTQDSYQPDYLEQLKETLEKLIDRSNQINDELRTDIFNDFINTLLEKLGPKRAHLLPLVTYLFDPASSALLEKLIETKYNPLIAQGMRVSDKEGYIFTLDIPKEEHRPIILYCQGHGSAIFDQRGKIEMFDITAKGSYKIYPSDGHVEFEGAVTEPLSPDIIGFI